jgi:hypothetical protein
LLAVNSKCQTTQNDRQRSTLNFAIFCLDKGEHLKAFNAPNHVNLGTPNGSFGAGPTGTNNNDAFGRITGSRDPRLMQLGLKLIF